MPGQEIKFATGKFAMGSSPINPAWILEGNPVARNKVIGESADKMASTLMWDCTAGRFNWHYACDESICVVEGSVIIRDHFGVTRTLNEGDSAFFPSGSSAEWTVDTYVRKVAVMRQPTPRSIMAAKRVYQQLKRILGARVSEDRAPAMSPTA